MYLAIIIITINIISIVIFECVLVARALFGSTYTKIETIQRRLAWPLHKDDMQIREVFHILGASLVAQRLKHLLPMQETQIHTLGWEDLLEKEMVTHSSILA